MDFKNKKILLGICASIAAYKSMELIRKLIKLGANVKVVLTPAAQKFVSPLTIQALSQNPVRVEQFDLSAEHAMSHIELARWADIFLIAPASANFIARIAQGAAEDLLSTIYLTTRAPTFIVPAMNACMWSHSATVANVALLKVRNVQFIGPDEGLQACGEEGFGRLVEVQHILDSLYFSPLAGLFANKRVLITAGPTRESIDPVRFISNKSSGKMGYNLGKAFLAAGAEVTLISGPTNLVKPRDLNFISVETYQEMHNAVFNELKESDIFIGCAAVADFKLQNSLTKLKKPINVSWVTIENPDIIAEVVKSRRASFVVGFAAETENLIENAKTKLNAKGLDLIIANNVADNLGFDRDENEVTIISPNEKMTLPKQDKSQLALNIVKIIAANLKKDRLVVKEELCTTFN